VLDAVEAFERSANATDDKIIAVMTKASVTPSLPGSSMLSTDGHGTERVHAAGRP